MPAIEHARFSLPLPDGRACAVALATPCAPPPPHGWPVAYVLDLSQYRTMLDAGPLPGVLVGVAPQMPQDRRRDYVPARWRPDARSVAGGPQDVPVPAGGAAQWLRLLDRVRREAAARCHLDPCRQVLCGHSLGGLFALYALLHRPGAFDGYVISSPSVWWGDGYAGRLLLRRRAWLCRHGLPALGVALTVGALEQGLGPEDASEPPEEQARRLQRRQARRMVDGCRDLARDLSACRGLRLQYRILAGCGHRTAPQAALRSGWQWLLQG